MNEPDKLLNRFNNIKIRPAKKQRVSFVKRLRELLRNGTKEKYATRESMLGIRG